jgi:hypothetical protein
MNDFTSIQRLESDGDVTRGEEEEAQCTNVVITTTTMSSQMMKPSPRTSFNIKQKLLNNERVKVTSRKNETKPRLVDDNAAASKYEV